MIILRQKLYTFQDRKVIHELWSNTKRFRNLPAGYENLTPRDLYRINRFTKGFNNTWVKRKRNAIDWAEFGVVANHMGLPETAKGAQHLVEKYSNPELLERYRSIKAHKLGLGNEYKVLKEAPQEMQRLINLSYTRDLTANELSTLNNLTNQLQESKEKLKAIDRKEGKIDSSELTLPGIILGIFKRKAANSATTEKAVAPAGRAFKNRQIKLGQAAGNAVDRDTESNEELYKKLLAETKKHKKKVIYEGNKNAARLGTNQIYNSDRMDSTLAHELGHHQVYRRMSGKKSARRYHLENGRAEEKKPPVLFPFPSLSRGRVKNPMYHLSEELKASYQALATLKKLGASREEIARAKRQLENAYKTYYHDELSNIPTRLNDRTRFIDPL